MAAPANFPEEECFNIYWKVKNFSYCSQAIRSTEFSISENHYWLMLNLGLVDVECKLQGLVSNRDINLKREISFLTNDGSPEISASGGSFAYLRVPRDVLFGKRQKVILPEDTLTVRFRALTVSARGKLFISSQIGVKREYFLWTIENSRNYQINAKKIVEKSELYGDIVLNLKFTDEFETDDYIEISRSGGERSGCNLKVSVLDKDGKAISEVRDAFVFEKNDCPQTREVSLNMEKSKLLTNKNQFPPQYALSLKCNFAISLGTVTDQTALISYNINGTSLLKEFKDISKSFKEKKESGSITELQSDLKTILDDGIFFDTSLQIGSEVIQAHKNILSARSPVFRAMFTKDMEEANKNIVVIEDLDLGTVRGLLLYMYTGAIHDDEWDNMKKLYFASDKYEVLSLKEKCASFLITKLSVSNVSEALVLADLHQDTDLMPAAFNFISEHDSAVFASEAWKELEKNNASLAFEVLRQICCTKRFR